MRRNRIFRMLAAGPLVLLGCGDSEPQPGEAPPAAVVPEGPASVWFVEPMDGDTVVGPDVEVILGASGVEITPADVQREGTAHHHIFIDRDVTPMQDTIPSGVTGIIHMGDGRVTHTVLGLEPGEHRLIAVLADWAHIPLDPPAVDTIFFTVVDPPAP